MRGVQSRQGQDCARERVGLAVNVVTAFHRALPVTMRSAPATPPSLPMAADASALELYAWNHIYILIPEIIWSNNFSYVSEVNKIVLNKITSRS